MRNKDNSVGIAMGIAIALITLFIIVITPLFVFWLGYFYGWLAKCLLGNILTNGLNTVFHTSYFTKDMLPIMGGVLAWIGSFFKVINAPKKSK